MVKTASVAPVSIRRLTGLPAMSRVTCDSSLVMMMVFLGADGKLGPRQSITAICREAVGLRSLWSRDNLSSSALFVCTGARLFWRIWALLTPVVWASTFKQGSLTWCSFSGISRVVLRWLRPWSIYNCSQKTGLSLVSSSGTSE